MTSIRSEVLLLALLLALAGCGPDDPGPASAPEPVAQPLVRALEDTDPAVRRRAAEGLGRLEDASLEVIHALLFVQYDDDTSVAKAAIAALDRIHPGPDVALRIFGGECYEEVAEDVIVRPAYTTWRKVACEPTAPVEGEPPGECWSLVEIPPVLETRIKHVLTHPEAGRWRDARDVRADDLAAIRATPPPPPPPPMEKTVPPEGEPAGARPGEVWCWYETTTGRQWRRHPECEVPPAPR